jgi:hypothetical protein
VVVFCARTVPGRLTVFEDRSQSMFIRAGFPARFVNWNASHAVRLLQAGVQA